VQKQFESNILKNKLFTKHDKLLLAISGGVDSVVLTHLLTRGNYSFSLAHCNFKLRGKDSDMDEKFCKGLADKLNVKLYSTTFNVKEYCRQNKVSIQMAARELRYNWFYKILKENDFDYIVTAHHAGDVTETMLINLLRGTGINGLKGIPEKNDNVVRPLLSVSKEEILEYALKNKIKFRQDKSNLEDKYERNFLRLKIIPLLKKINPDIHKTFHKNTLRFAEEALIVNEYLSEKAKSIVKKRNSEIVLDKSLLSREKHLGSLLHHILNPYGFNETQKGNIRENVISESIPGKKYVSAMYELVVDRKELIITEINSNSFAEIKIQSYNELLEQKDFKVSKETKLLSPRKNELLIEKDKLVFPLTIRIKKTGDKFKPFGMKGFKLLSDFLKDEKVTATEKKNCRLLINGNGEIIWVIGYRSDERYRIEPGKKEFLKISVVE